MIHTDIDDGCGTINDYDGDFSAPGVSSSVKLRPADCISLLSLASSPAKWLA